MQNHTPKDKNIHILFLEQAVCGKGTKMEKAYLLSVVSITMLFPHSLTESETKSTLIKRTETKRGRECVYKTVM